MHVNVMAEGTLEDCEGLEPMIRGLTTVSDLAVLAVPMLVLHAAHTTRALGETQILSMLRSMRLWLIGLFVVCS